MNKERQRIVAATKKLAKYQPLIEMAANGQPTYYNANEAVLNFYPEVRSAVLENTGGQRIKLSPGISTLPTFPDIITQACEGISDRDLYVNYSAPFGTLAAVNALRRYESTRLVRGDELIYPPNGIYVTSGGTEAINLAFEYLNQAFPKGRLAVLGLSYYLFPFISDRLGIGTDVIIPDKLTPSTQTRFLPSIEDVRNQLRPEVKAIIVTQPSNPTGEYFSRGEVAELVDLAIEKDLIIVSDNVFAELVYKPDNFTTFEQVAFQKGALNRILSVRSYSKNYNIPGLRVGYLANSDPEIGRELSFISERIKCCPPTIFNNLINYVSFLQTVDFELSRDPTQPVKNIIGKVQGWYEFGQGPNPIPVLEQKFGAYKDFMNRVLSFYGDNFDLTMETLGDEMDARNAKNTAFNTLAKIKDIPSNTNFFDFCVNLYMTCGIETQIGPCFGMGQERWEKDLGFWLRVTYTLPPEELRKGLRTVIAFRDVYAKKPDLFLKTGLRF